MVGGEIGDADAIFHSILISAFRDKTQDDKVVISAIGHSRHVLQDLACPWIPEQDAGRVVIGTTYPLETFMFHQSG